RELLGQEIGRIGDVNTVTGKGRHTTTSAVLYEAGGFRIIDTPGVREFCLIDVEPDDLKLLFPEMRELQCQNKFCAHENEEGCQARGLPRYESYLRILESLKEAAQPKRGRKSPWR